MPVLLLLLSSLLYHVGMCSFNGLVFTFNLQVSDLTENLSVLQDAYNHLTSRDPEKFWTSGQWMTERKGGSDVGQ